MQRFIGAIAFLLVGGCPGDRASPGGKAAAAGKALTAKTPSTVATTPTDAKATPPADTKTVADAKAARPVDAQAPTDAKEDPTAAPSDDPPSAPDGDKVDPVQQAQALLGVDGAAVSAKVPWRDENRFRLMSRLSSMSPALAQSMIASISAVDNDQTANSFEGQFATVWHDMEGCAVTAYSGPTPKLPGADVLGQLPPAFAEAATRLKSARFAEVRCEADGRSFVFGFDAKGIVSARDTTPKDKKMAP